MTQPAFLATISVPRTGSSHFANHLRPIRGVRYFGEVFNPRASFSLKSGHFERLAELLGQPIEPDLHDPATVEAVRTHPDEMLRVMREFSGERTTAFKLFPGHLPIEWVTGRFLARDDVAAVVLQRRPIDSFASAEKARQKERWRVEDTTGDRIEGDAERYQQWAARHERWYRAVIDALDAAHRPFALVSYEDDVATDSEPLIARIAEIITDLGVDPQGVDPLQWSTPRQDSTARSEDKFTNWDDFAADLEQRGLLRQAMTSFV